MDNHRVLIENQCKIEVSEVESLDAFDDQVILVNLKEGGLILKGENLKVTTLDVDGGTLIAEGKILTLSYVKHRKRSLPKIFNR